MAVLVTGIRPTARSGARCLLDPGHKARDDNGGILGRLTMLVRGGMRTIQTIGVPAAPLDQEVDAVVVALKSRTIPVRQAVAQSLTALAWLKRAGCRQYYFKYCSTFDSTPK